MCKEDKEQDQQFLMLPNNGNGICYAPITHCSTALPARAVQPQGGPVFVSMQAHGEGWGQPIPLWPCQFVHSPHLEQPELQTEMFLQGSAAEQRLGAWSRTSHQRSWGELLGPQAGHHHRDHPHGPATQHGHSCPWPWQRGGQGVPVVRDGHGVLAVQGGSRAVRG